MTNVQIQSVRQRPKRQATAKFLPPPEPLVPRDTMFPKYSTRWVNRVVYLIEKTVDLEFLARGTDDIGDVKYYADAWSHYRRELYLLTGWDDC